MYYELYIDVLFLENLLMDYLLLSLLGRLLKCPAGRVRKLLAAALGSVGLCLVYLFSLEGTLFGTLLIYGVIGTVMTAAGLRIRRWRLLGKAVVLLYLCSLLLGGLFQIIWRDLSIPLLPFLGFSLAAYWILSAVLEWLLRFRQRSRDLYETVVAFRGRSIKARGLLDTGNQLRDPIFGKPVSIITEELQKELCQGEEVLCQQIPFHSLGKQNGMMAAFFADYLYIRTAKSGVKRIERPLLGITKEPLSSKNEYGILLHPELLE